jgi:Protein of unknown function (DUF1549)/Protein of unknown function (DUF1553)/Planctomycete cytochrome C
MFDAMIRMKLTFAFGILCFATAPLLAVEPVLFERTIRPILKQHCWHCHGEEPKLEGGLDSRLAKFLTRGGETGAAIEPGDHRSSLLFQRIAAHEMPPGDKKVTDEQLRSIAAWIDQGAKTESPEPESLAIGDVILESDRRHWSFQKITRPSIPSVSDSSQVRTPIDAFLLAKLESQGQRFSEEANRTTLIRRLSFDLVGLPPDLSMLDSVLSDESEDWYEKSVDRLLASPAYGERWGRHWLDVVGYADSHGYTEKDNVRKWAWKYRDYVIQSFNEDKPWDQMIVEQLAGDELVGQPLANLSEDQIESLVATGYLRMIPDGTADSGVDVAVASNDVIAETIKVVSSSLLGLTVGCAQCHSHRYDPISHTDYYRFRAIFEPAYDWKAWKTPEKRLVSLWSNAIRKTSTAVEKELKEITEQRNAALDELVESTFESELDKLPSEIQSDARTVRQVVDKERSSEQKQLVKKYPFLNVNRSTVYLYLPDRLKGFNKKWDEATEAIKKKRPPEDYVDCLSEPIVSQKKPPETFVFYRGDQNSPKNSVEPGELSVLVSQPNPVKSRNDETSTTQRRLSYARYLTNGKHPLVARVLVNRFWMHHFGRGIVPSVTDFGLLGEQPSHPELLDWLADEFIQRGWSLKELHRLILTSTAYRQASTRRNELDAIDPDNILLGRMSIRRLEAEVVRDAILTSSGRLSSKRFGVPVPVTPDEVGQIVIGLDNRDSAGRPKGKLEDMGEEAVRRSIYVQVRRTMPLGVLEPFDNPIMFPNCGQRACSTVAPQSLLLMNNEFVAVNAEAFAEQIQRSQSTEDLQSQVRYAWLCAFGCQPSREDIERGVAFLESGKASDKRLMQFCHALLCSNPFLYVE